MDRPDFIMFNNMIVKCNFKVTCFAMNGVLIMHHLGQNRKRRHLIQLFCEQYMFHKSAITPYIDLCINNGQLHSLTTFTMMEVES